MSIGRISNSLAAATVENSLSLFQFNFDFTFKKTAPPIEFHPVGQALSANRRQNAENGAAHRTARKLGWLFEQLVPDTPRLLRAYGIRVCEILQQPGINPVGSAADGPFRDYVGADCTSLWAAATSGIAALGVHLLACMLARAWDAQTATAIWVELVESRQADILGKLRSGYVISETSVTAARQEYLRSELSYWDASARSWLAQADKAFVVKRDQYLLIVKNISLSTGMNTDPYANVVATWVLAMSTMERHFEGISQEVSDGAILYAISAWHLYPNLVHYGSGAKDINFDDPLFQRHATMTLGLTEFSTNPENRGTHWSLCLSHLKFYGDPVRVESVEDKTRATLPQFLVIVLGSVLENWHVSIQDRLDAIKWIRDLWGIMKRTAPYDPGNMPLASQTSWMAVLGEAADIFTSATGSLQEQYENYLDHGELWGRRFLLDLDSADHSSDDPVIGIRPYFGLCNPMLMQALEEPLDIDAGITYLRALAKSIGVAEDEGIICYSEIRGSRGYFEYCTATPHLDTSMKSRHARWLKTAPSSKGIRGRKLGCSHISHRGSDHGSNRTKPDLDFRMKMVTSRGEQCFHLDEGSLHERPDAQLPNESHMSMLFWEKAPTLFTARTTGHPCSQVDAEGVYSCSCLCPISPGQSSSKDEDGYETTPVTFRRYAGNIVDAGEERDCFFELYVRTAVSKPAELNRDMNTATKMSVKPSIGSQWLNGPLPQPTRLWDYIERCGNPRDPPKLGIEESVAIPAGLDWTVSHGRAADLISNHILSQQSSNWLYSLKLVGVVNEIYKNLPGATISLSVLEYPIIDAFWGKIFPHGDTLGGYNAVGTKEILQGMGREETFACIAMMQTGSANIEPADLIDVMAMSADNSIFVAGALLSDPHMTVDPRFVRHIVGNVGFSGLNIMVSPAGTLKIRPPKNEIRTVARWKYDFIRQDKFGGSSLHLSFTGQRFPLISTDANNIDQGIFHLQTIISLWNEGKHVADLNILDVQRTKLCRVQLECSCADPLTEMHSLDLRCLDSWDDVLRPPRRMAVMRSRDNWPARLAAAAIFIQQREEHLIAYLPDEILCWRCLEKFFTGPDDEKNWPQILID